MAPVHTCIAQNISLVFYHSWNPPYTCNSLPAQMIQNALKVNCWIYLMLENAGNHTHSCIHSEQHYSFVGPNRTSKAELDHQTVFFFFIYLFSLKFLQTIPLDFSHFLRTVSLVGCRQPKWWGVQKKYCCDDTGWQVEPDQGTEETSKICDNWCLTVSNFHIVNFQMC